jgi:hypothetical protein
LDIDDGLFWGTLIFLAPFLFWFLAWRAIERLRKPKVDDAAAKGRHHKDPEDPWIHTDPEDPWIHTDPEDPWVDSISRALEGHDGAALGQSPPIAGAVMNQREQEEIFSAAREARKEMERRRTAREQAQKKRAGTS